MSLFLKLPRCGVHMTRGEWAAGGQDWKVKTLGGDRSAFAEFHGGTASRQTRLGPQDTKVCVVAGGHSWGSEISGAECASLSQTCPGIQRVGDTPPFFRRQQDSK